MTVEVGQRAVVSVAAATLWTSPTSAQDSDRLALGSRSAIRDWVAGMTREQRVEGLNDRSESQLLLGDDVEVDAIEQGWAKVVASQQPSEKDSRGYPGWVPLDQLTTSTKPRDEVTHYVSATATAVRDEPDGEVLIPGVTLGTRLSVIPEEPYRGWVRVALPGPQQPGWVRRRDLSAAPDTAASGTAGRIDAVNVASQLLDVPYVWGGLTAYGIDCSGLIYLVFRQLGIDLPRDAHDQAAASQAVDQEQVEAGDLYLFARPGKTIHHIGLATDSITADGERTIIHAAGNYGKVVQEPLTGERADTFIGVHSVFKK